MAKLSPSASEGTKGRAERGVGEAEGDQGPDQGQSNVADARPEQVSSWGTWGQPVGWVCRAEEG